MATRDAPLTETLLQEFGRMLQPLLAVNDEASVRALARDCGWELPSVSTQLITAVTSAAATAHDVRDGLLALQQAETDSDYANAADDLVSATVNLFRAVRALESTIGSKLGDQPFEGRDDFAEQFPRRIIDYLIVRYLYVSAPRAHASLALLGIIETVPQPTEDARFRIRTIHWSRLPKLITNPAELAETVYTWNSGFNSDRFFERLAALMHALVLSGGIYEQDDVTRDALGRTTNAALELRVPLWSAGRWPTYAEAGITASALEVLSERKKGLALLPYLVGAKSISGSPGQGWTFTFVGSAALGGGIAVLLRPPTTLELKTDLLTAAMPSDIRLEATFTRQTAPDREWVLFGKQGESSLTVSGFGVRTIGEKSARGQDLALELRIDQLRLVLSAAGDGFLAKILPSDGIRAEMDLTVGWSTAKGFYFVGSAALEVEIPIHATLGPLTIHSIYVQIGVAEGVIKVAIAATAGAAFGPIAAVVERVGIKTNLSFPDNGGNVGPVQVDKPFFLAPIGAGLLIAAGPVAGGGFIKCNPDEGSYDGILQLRFEDIGLTAIGLINTKMPDGKPGFALLISIGVTFSPAIQLSFGFVLSAVGGLLAVNRRMDVDVLRKGLRSGTLDSILFPEDPIRDAPIILSNMKAAFPIEEGRYVVGPMATIGWGSPTIITADIGIFIELPAPVLIALLGQIAAAFPKKDDAIVELHIDVLGELNPAKRRLSIDATLHHSKILAFTLTGDAALRWRWGDDSLFVMSLGGFHPKFKDKPGDVDLKRLTIALRSSSAFDLSCRAYQALTSNTLQFGAQLNLHVEVSKASVDGELSFDALIQFSPFEFEVEIRGHVTAEAFSKSISIRLTVNLSGPTPWHARGRASFEICCRDIEVDFEKEWGRDDRVSVAACDPLNPLLVALNRRESWTSVLPPRSVMLEMLRPPDPPAPSSSADAASGSTAPTPVAPPAVFAHPTGTLEVRQKVAPLNLKLEKLGSGKVKDHIKFRLVKPAGSTNVLEIVPRDEAFARAQFEDLSDSSKLSAPSFEKMQAGVALGSEQLGAYGDVAKHRLEFDNVLIDTDTTATRKGRTALSWQRGKRIVRGSAARRSPLRSSGRHRFERINVPAKVVVAEEAYVVVRTETLAVVPMNSTNRPDRGMTRMEAEQEMDAWIDTHPADEGKLEVVLACEAA